MNITFDAQSRRRYYNIFVCVYVSCINIFTDTRISDIYMYRNISAIAMSQCTTIF